MRDWVSRSGRPALSRKDRARVQHVPSARSGATRRAPQRDAEPIRKHVQERVSGCDAPSASTSSPDAAGWTFASSTTRHFDNRLGLTYRASQNAILRASAGSAIAPPYINLLSQINGAISAQAGAGTYLQTKNAGGLKPETAFGWDLGADVRLHDGVTSLSTDVYSTTLYNAFITQVYDSGIECTTAYNPKCTNPGELFFKSNVNLNRERYEGAELAVRRSPDRGFGYRFAGGLQKAYAYNLPQCFYSTTTNNCAAFNTNLAIVPGINSSGNAVNSAGGILNGFSNQSIPYFNGSAELSYRFDGGAYLAFGETFYGKNNSLNENPFQIARVTARVPLNDSLSLQVSGDNIFNTLSGYFPIQGAACRFRWQAFPPVHRPVFRLWAQRTATFWAGDVALLDHEIVRKNLQRQRTLQKLIAVDAKGIFHVQKTFKHRRRAGCNRRRGLRRRRYDSYRAFSNTRAKHDCIHDYPDSNEWI